MQRQQVRRTRLVDFHDGNKPKSWLELTRAERRLYRTHKRKPKAADPTSVVARLTDGTRYRMFEDGSWRRQPPKLRGKANVRAAKRRRRYSAEGKRITVRRFV